MRVSARVHECVSVCVGVYVRECASVCVGGERVHVCVWGDTCWCMRAWMGGRVHGWSWAEDVWAGRRRGREGKSISAGGSVRVLVRVRVRVRVSHHSGTGMPVTVMPRRAGRFRELPGTVLTSQWLPVTGTLAVTVPETVR